MCASTKKHTPQLGLFHGLADQLDQKYPLYQLVNKIDWSFLMILFISITAKIGDPVNGITIIDKNLVEHWAEKCVLAIF